MFSTKRSQVSARVTPSSARPRRFSADTVKTHQCRTCELTSLYAPDGLSFVFSAKKYCSSYDLRRRRERKVCRPLIPANQLTHSAVAGMLGTAISTRHRVTGQVFLRSLYQCQCFKDIASRLSPTSLHVTFSVFSA